jgi:ubiquinone/menaquinone biosynthesis C-methylase UbiE
METPLDRILDIGCGTGFSTAPLRGLAAQLIGIEPSRDMLTWSRAAVPEASFVAGTAEALPLRSHSVDMITAAGCLNWADLSEFLPEARRVLSKSGTLVIYDFGQGLGFDRLANWDAEFKRRYPPPPCREIGADSLDPKPFGLRTSGYEPFEVRLSLTPEFYLEYALTEINVDEALKRGTPEKEIRDWCARTLAPVFQGQAREILFSGYILYLVPV